MSNASTTPRVFIDGQQGSTGLRIMSLLEARKDLGPAAYAAFAEQWVEGGASIIGGCCEVGPAHIAELARRFDK